MAKFYLLERPQYSWQLQSYKESSRFRGLRCRSKDRPLVGLEDCDARAEVLCMVHARFSEACTVAAEMLALAEQACGKAATFAEREHRRRSGKARAKSAR